MIRAIKRALAVLFWCGLAGVFLFASWIYYRANSAIELPRVPAAFSIKPGSSLTTAARQLGDAGILPEPWAFTLLARALGKSGEIKAGNYELTENLTPLQLLAKLTKGDVKQIEIKFIEGWTFRQIRKTLDENPSLRHATARLTDQEILKLVGAKEQMPEGLFFPDTYFFAQGASDLAILKRAYQTMQAHLDNAWTMRSPGLPFGSPYEALILASVVEKETGRESERTLIAAVFANRLRIGMPLQADPTVIYGLGEKFDGNLRKSDLVADQAYNTYTRPGLPPTPIAMPGLNSIQATFNPANSSVLYFVARGDGTSQFSTSLEDHNRAVAKYQKKQ